MPHDTLSVPRAQDVHISCPTYLVELLVAAFQQQFANTPSAEVYDYGYSSRFGQGFVIVAWKGVVPPEFESQLDADDRLQGHTIYELPEQSHEPLFVAGKERVSA